MTDETECPICLGVDGVPAEVRMDFATNRSLVECPACGQFSITREAIYDYSRDLSEEQRRAVSHDLRWRNELGSDLPELTTASFVQYGVAESLPSMPEQLDNLLSFLALRLKHAGRQYPKIDPAMTSAIGAIDRAAAVSLVEFMTDGGYLTSLSASTHSGRDAKFIAPTLTGWVRAGELAKGRESEQFAFMAMKYGDPVLEAYVIDVIRPAIEETGHRLEVLRDRPAAGLIDNYLRSRLRLCKFVVADLTHANNGAYWEAGFAEGLGKPVIYTCERSVFDASTTHFDTNHSQTVVWHQDDPDETRKQLVACIQNTFPDSN